VDVNGSGTSSKRVGIAEVVGALKQGEGRFDPGTGGSWLVVGSVKERVRGVKS
jgi:hypothetical protein